MTDATTIRTDAGLIEHILECGFDPVVPVGRDEFLRVLATAEHLDAAGIAGLPEGTASMGEHFGETGQTLTLPAAIGHRWLDELLADTPVVFSGQAHSDAISALVRRLVTTLHQTVQFEAFVSHSTRSIPGADGTPAETGTGGETLLEPWLERWRMFPVLASLVTLVLVHWIRALEEMIRALERDHRAIAEQLTASATPLAIKGIQGDAGDLHLGGRSVMLLTFADDTRVVFKPKRLAITDVLRDLVTRLNRAGFEPPLRVHRAIVGDTHTWEQFVPHRSCTTETEIEQFYRRMGGWIRLLQVLEGRDFWLDNLIADGEHPVFIDLETIVQPRRPNIAMPEQARLVQDRLDASPTATSIVSMPTPIGPDVGSEDFGCFAAPRLFLAPFPATAIPGVSTDVIDDRGYRSWSHPEHAPLLHGEPAPSEPWYPAIETGYRAMAAAIDAVAPELLAPGGLIDQLCAHPTRTIYRDTWTCMKIINRSVAPPLLGNWQRRRSFLESMGRPSRMHREEQAGQIAAVTATEIRAIAALDVPFFTAIGARDAILPPDGPPIDGFFEGTVRDTIRQRLSQPNPEALEDDVALLRTAYWAEHRDAAPMVSPHTGRETGAIDPADVCAAAMVIGAHVLGGAAVTADGAMDWPALGYHTAVDLENLTPLGNDLLAGFAGLALLAHDQWRATGDAAWRQHARQLAMQVSTGVEQSRDWLRDVAGSPAGLKVSPPIVGAFAGLGGMVATAKLLGDALEDAPLRQVWNDAIDTIDWDAVLTHAPDDVVSGTIGLALAITARPEWVADVPASLRSRLLEIVLAEPGEAVVRPPGAIARLSGLPGDMVARGLVRYRFGELTEHALGSLAGRVLDAPEPSVGDLLGVIEMSRPDAPCWPRLASLVSTRHDALDGSSDRQAQIDAAEMALAMYRASGDRSWRDRAGDLAAGWIREFNETGSWFPRDLADDRYRLSSIWGVPAVASVLLRLADAPVVASPRTLDWRPWRV